MASPTVASLAKDLADLTVRVVALETLAGKNEKRISALEADMTAHKAGAIERQAEVDHLNDRFGPWKKVK